MPLKHSVEEVKLKNGSKGILVNVPDASVFCYEFNFRAGNNYVRDPSVQQTAHILEHMAFGGTKTYANAAVFSQEFSKNGASNNASTADMNLSYYGDCADMEWERILDLQRQSIVEPLFREQDLVAEKRNVREELVGQASNNVRVLWQHIGRNIGSRSFLDKEKIATIDAVQLEDITEHYARTHTLKNMRFVLAGNLSGDRRTRAIAQLESWQLPEGTERSEPLKEVAKNGDPVFLERRDVDNVRFGISFFINRQLSVYEENALDALNHILTGTFHSRIFGEARTQGLCYSMGSSASVNAEGSSEWSFGGQVSHENAPGLFELIVTQLQAVLAGDITEQELSEAKLYGLGVYQKSRQTVGSLAGAYGSDYFFDETIYLSDEVPDRINEIQLQDITRLAKELIASGIWCFGGLGTMTREQLDVYNDTIAHLVESAA